MPNNRSVWIWNLRWCCCICIWPPSPPLSSTSSLPRTINTKTQKKIALMNSRSRRASMLMRFHFNSLYWIDARLRHSHSSDTMQMTQSKFEMRWWWWRPERGNYYSCSQCSRLAVVCCARTVHVFHSTNNACARESLNWRNNEQTKVKKSAKERNLKSNQQSEGTKRVHNSFDFYSLLFRHKNRVKFRCPREIRTIDDARSNCNRIDQHHRRARRQNFQMGILFKSHSPALHISSTLQVISKMNESNAHRSTRTRIENVSWVHCGHQHLCLGRLILSIFRNWPISHNHVVAYSHEPSRYICCNYLRRMSIWCNSIRIITLCDRF